MRVKKALEDISTLPQARWFFHSYKSVITTEQQECLLIRIEEIKCFSNTRDWEIASLNELIEDIKEEFKECSSN
jgi:hypothetical protein